VEAKKIIGGRKHLDEEQAKAILLTTSNKGKAVVTCLSAMYTNGHDILFLGLRQLPTSKKVYAFPTRDRP
jgi:hypothetical protein